MPEIKKSFVVTINYSEKELKYIADANKLSLEQLTDEKLAEFLQEDLTNFVGEGVSVTPDLTKIAEG